MIKLGVGRTMRTEQSATPSTSTAPVPSENVPTAVGEVVAAELKRLDESSSVITPPPTGELRSVGEQTPPLEEHNPSAIGPFRVNHTDATHIELSYDGTIPKDSRVYEYISMKHPSGWQLDGILVAHNEPVVAPKEAATGVEGSVSPPGPIDRSQSEELPSGQVEAEMSNPGAIGADTGYTFKVDGQTIRVIAKEGESRTDAINRVRHNHGLGPI